MGSPEATVGYSGAKPESAQCPMHNRSSEFSEWLDRGLLCSAGKREFRLDRYHVARVKDGAEFGRELELFRGEVSEYRKSGFLAILARDTSHCRMAEDELWLLGTLLRDAGLARSAAPLIFGETVAIPFELCCPVTGELTTYEFFPVAFCRNSANPGDPLHDPSLSAPFTAINTTSDAFAFALLTREQAIKMQGRPPAEIRSRSALQAVFARSVQIWQSMSVNTILNYNRAAGGSARAVHLSEDRRLWFAPHNDPVFAELEKRQHAHEMPTIYAERLCEKWLGTMFDLKPAARTRDGQSGGRPVPHFNESGHELHQF